MRGKKSEKLMWSFQLGLIYGSLYFPIFSGRPDEPGWTTQARRVEEEWNARARGRTKNRARASGRSQPGREEEKKEGKDGRKEQEGER